MSSSFRGGTDAIRPLKWAIHQLQGGDDASGSGSGGGGGGGRYSDADVLIVTDGELRMPPVDDDVLRALTTLREEVSE